jgi:hypothetical protein
MRTRTTQAIRRAVREQRTGLFFLMGRLPRSPQEVIVKEISNDKPGTVKHLPKNPAHTLHVLLMFIHLQGCTMKWKLLEVLHCDVHFGTW